MQDVGYIGRHGQDFLRHLHQLFQGRIDIFRFFLEVLGQHEVVVRHDFAQLGFKVGLVAQIADTYAATGHLVFVGRADTTTGGADLVVTLGALAGLVDTNMGTQDNRAGQADLQALTNLYTVGFQFTDFLEQGFRRQNHTVTDQALDVLTQNTGRNQVQRGLLAIDYQGMTGVMATLEPYNGRHLVCQKVDNLALAFITPLGAQHNYIFTHDSLSHQAARRQAPCKFTRKYQQATGAVSAQSFQNPLAVTLDQLPVAAP